MSLSHLIILATALFCCLPFSFAGSNVTDRMALLEIKAKITHDPLSVMSSWNDTLHFCEWHGVTCGHRHQRVVELNLQSAKLSGILSTFVGNLSFLVELHLQNNSFGGTIPSEISNLKRLQSLWLFNNSFAGEIPTNISACSNLVELNLSYNELVGEIPSELGLLLHLQVLDLAVNNLTGFIPSSLGNLSSLSNLLLARNNLVGSIPESLGRLKHLISLKIPMNQLSGTVPPSVFNLSSMLKMDMAYNNLEGSLPSDIGFTLPDLNYFSIFSNGFTGNIPASISNSSNLEVLQLTLNNLQGQVPSLQRLVRLRTFSIYSNSLGSGRVDDLEFVSSLANATMLSTFDISANKFKGNFPKTICNFAKLSYLGVEYNQIDGQIPTCIQDLASLQFFTASSNQLSGAIPQDIWKLQNLRGLYLATNQLSGFIPSSIGNLTMLTDLELAQNNLEGHIPSGLGNCRNLLALDLAQNRLSGNIPSELLSLSTLSIILNLSNNHLTGPLPVEVGGLNKLGTLDISGNELSGEIPSTLSACIGLESLNMRRNFFHGTIPDTMKTLMGLRVLDLSRNNLSGEIPTFLASLPLQNLDLSFNKLEGQVPIGGVFSNASGVLVAGNNRLCGGIPKLKLPHCSFSIKTQKRRWQHKMKLIITLLCVFLGLTVLVALLSLYVFRYRKRQNKPTTSVDLEKFPNLSYQSILKATNGLSEGNLIGTGASGFVYKGTRDQDGTLVAIKIFNLEYYGAFRSFMAECKVLRNIRHRNLVKVITACSSTDYQGNDFKALVYEYMVNGSLDDWLHQKEISGVEGTSMSSRNLSLLQRLDIVVDIATALDYLHQHSGVPIVHCDLKPSNVLLDGEMVAHVSDFGLAKFISEDVISSSAGQSSSIGVRGTIGYTPPEYGLGNEVSTCGDVYSFGILVLEIFSGRRPTDDMFKEGYSLHNFVSAALPDQVTEILDPSLVEVVVREEAVGSMMKEAAISVLDAALSCSAELPRERPDMSDVVLRLSSIRKNLLTTTVQ